MVGVQLKVATPLTAVIVPKVVCPDMKVTVPVYVGSLHVAVKVTAPSPTTIVVGEATRASVAWEVTVTVTVLLVMTYWAYAAAMPTVSPIAITRQIKVFVFILPSSPMIEKIHILAAETRFLRS